MKSYLIALIFAFNTHSALASNPPKAINLLGTWTGTSNSAVYGWGLFHPTEVGKEQAIRFRNIEYQIVIDRQEGRNFSGRVQAVSSKHKEILLGSFAKNLKSGVMVNENGTFTFNIDHESEMEICFTQVKSHAVITPRVASCFELKKQ
jgi:hypothetical protein